MTKQFKKKREKKKLHTYRMNNAPFFKQVTLEFTFVTFKGESINYIECMILVSRLLHVHIGPLLYMFHRSPAAGLIYRAGGWQTFITVIKSPPLRLGRASLTRQSTFMVLDSFLSQFVQLPACTARARGQPSLTGSVRKVCSTTSNARLHS